MDIIRDQPAEQPMPRVNTFAQDATLLINTGGDKVTEVHRITGASWVDWHNLAGAMVGNNFRFRARAIDTALYEKFRPVLEGNKYICTVNGAGVIDFTDLGKEVLQRIHLLPIESRNMPEGVFRRLTHAPHTLSEVVL